jgi:predicted SAM-dependent methyltransferase
MPARKLHSYQKVRQVIGTLLRNRRFQARDAKLAGRDYLNIGCGPFLTSGFVNLDYRWVPGIDVVWDLRRPLPFRNDRFSGAFCEHCLEHFDEPELREILTEFHRVLRPGGRLRLVVPSLEIHVRAYLTAQTATESPAAAREINRVFYDGHRTMRHSHWINDGHHFIHDFATLADALRRTGFVTVEKKSFQHGADPHLLIDQAERECESLYVEALKS